MTVYGDPMENDCSDPIQYNLELTSNNTSSR